MLVNGSAGLVGELYQRKENISGQGIHGAGNGNDLGEYNMDKIRRDIGKSAIEELVRERNRLVRDIGDWTSRIVKINSDMDSIVEEIIYDGDEYYE